MGTTTRALGWGLGIVLAVGGQVEAVQYARPDGTVSAGSWTASGAPTLHEAVDETTPNDNTDYISAGGNTTAELSLSNITDPGVSTGHIIRFRFETFGGGSKEKCELKLYQGSTLIATTGTKQSRNEYRTFAYTLSDAEANAITDYSDLRFRIVSSNVGNGEEVRVTWVELEVPGAAANPPTVTNPSIAAVEDTTATLGGEVTDTGGATVTERGVYWSTTQGFTPPGEGTKVSTSGAWNTPFTFTENVTGLTQSTLIYFKAFATNSAGDGFSNEASFRTEPAAQASNIQFSSVTSSSMTISWTAGSGDGALVIMKQGSAVTQTPTDGTEHPFNSAFGDAGTDLGGGEYVVYRGAATSVNVTNLQAETTYYVKVFEYAGAGSGVTGINYQQDGPPSGSQTTAGAGPPPPTVENPSIAAVEDTTATLGGEVTASSALPVTETGIYWSTTQGFTPPAEGTKVSTTGSWNTIPLTFAENVTGLTESALIYFKAFAVDGVGEGFSAETSFQTEPATQAHTIQFPTVNATSMTVSWTAGSGDGALVIMKQGSTVTQLPVDGTEHPFNSSFGDAGTDLGGGEYVVYRGPANSVTVTSLLAETTYFVKVFEYAGSGSGVAGINYQQDGVEEQSQTTAAAGAGHNDLRNIQCDQCHAIHDTLIPRGTDQENTCKSCHNATQMGAENPHLWDITVHTVNGGATIVDCGSCHAVHNYDFTTDNTSHGGGVAENIARIRWDTSKYVPGALEPAIFQERPAHFAFPEQTFPSGPFNGICQTCHQNTKNHTNDGWDDDDGVPADNNHEAGGNCTVCHAHADGFQPTGCTGCHNTAQDKGDGGPTRRAVVGEFSLTSHHVVGGAVTDNDCKVCHYEAVDSQNYHQNNQVDLRDPDTGNPITAFTKFTRDRSTDTLEAWITSVQNNFCMKCHDIDGATATFNADEGGTALRPFSANSRDVPEVYSRFDPANSFHHAVRAAGTNPYCIPSGSNGNRITMEPPWNQDGTHDQITCFDCHGDVVTDPDGTANLVTVHGGNNQRMLRTAVDFDGMEAAGSADDPGLLPSGLGASVETFCTTCHKASVYVTSNDSEAAGSIYEYHGQSQQQHSAGGGNDLGCMGCHGGIVDFGPPAPDNGARRGNLHGDNFTWPTGSFAAGTPTEHFLLGGWLSGWESDATKGYCRGGDCNHTNSSKNYTR